MAARLAICRAVIFASLVDDPSSYLCDPEADEERQRLFRLLGRLAEWSGAMDETVLAQARSEIARSVARNSELPEPRNNAEVKNILLRVAPAIYDPFCGSGSISVEAQRLGLRSVASDLNPVAVLLTRALIDLPVRNGNYPPVNRAERAQRLLGANWRGTAGLTADLRHYAKWMRDEAERQIGSHYPEASNGGKVIAWLWARTVRCPNPACSASVPLVRSFWLSTKKVIWVEPIVQRDSSTSAGHAGAVRFVVRTGVGSPPGGTIGRRGARCIVCETPVPFDYLRSEGRAGRIGHELLATVTEVSRRRHYLAPDEQQRDAAKCARPDAIPDAELPHQALGFRVQLYGMTRYSDLFTPRQLTALATLSNLVDQARTRVLADAGDALAARAPSYSGLEASSYATAIATYLACAVGRAADRWSSLNRWLSASEGMAGTFGRPTLSMIWDYCEANPFSDSLGSWVKIVDSVADSIAAVPADAIPGEVQQRDAATTAGWNTPVVLSTDPPYYDNIGYAHLSDYFYTWLRPILRDLYPGLFQTLQTPKSQGNRSRCLSQGRDG